MKSKSFKTTVFFALLITLPFISKAQEFPPEHGINTPVDSWVLVVIGGFALYGLVKMWSKNQHVK